MSFEKIMDTLGQTKALSLFHPSHKEMCFKCQKGECNNAFTCGRIPASAVVQRASPTTSATVSVEAQLIVPP